MHRKKHIFYCNSISPKFPHTTNRHTLSVCGIFDSTLAFNACSIGTILLAKYSSKLKSVTVDWNKFVVVDLMEVGEEGTKHDAFCIDNASNAAFISVDEVIIKRCLCCMDIRCSVLLLFYWRRG